MKPPGKQAPQSPVDQHIRCWRQGTAVIVQLNRPERANSYTQEMLAELEQEIIACDADPLVRAIVITGNGERNFCAGADRTEIAERDWRSVLTLQSAQVFRRIQASRCVTIAAINGAAVGGGFELAMHCDLRFAVDTARFWLPEPELGLIPAAGGLKLLPQLAGVLRAKEMILGGAQWSAQDALQYGVLTEVTTAETLFERIGFWIERISRRDADAVAFAKRAFACRTDGQGLNDYDLMVQALLVLKQRSTVD